MKLLPRKLHIVPAKLVRPIGTSVQYVAYIPREDHLKFARQHNRNLGELERMVMPRPWTSILGGLAAGAIIAIGIGMLLI